MKIINVRLPHRSYKIIISRNIIGRIGKFLKALPIGADLVIVTNPRLSALYKNVLTRSLAKEGFTSRVELIPDGERAKSEKVVAGVIEKISSFDKRRSLSLIAFGGGVVGDAAGFIASVYKRGIPYVQVPTTLLAQVDSAIGGKVAIDLPVAKNLVGSFYQPKLVVSDITLLKSLPKKQMINGLAEVIKYGVIADRSLFEYLEKNLEKVLASDEEALECIVVRSSSIKAGLVEKDEYDKKGIRMVLNYGHTIGHAIEAASGYSRRYAHGEAVATGMVVANRIAVKMGLLKERDLLRIKDLIERAGLPIFIKGVDIRKVYEAHLFDKKFTGKVNRLVLPVGIGKTKVVRSVDETFIKEAIKESSEG